MCVQVASQLRLFDPQLREKPEQEAFVEPAWLVQLQRVDRQLKVRGASQLGPGDRTRCDRGGSHARRFHAARVRGGEYARGVCWSARSREREGPPEARPGKGPAVGNACPVSPSGGRRGVELGRDLPPALSQHPEL